MQLHKNNPQKYKRKSLRFSFHFHGSANLIVHLIISWILNIHWIYLWFNTNDCNFSKAVNDKSCSIWNIIPVYHNLMCWNVLIRAKLAPDHDNDVTWALKLIISPATRLWGQPLNLFRPPTYKTAKLLVIDPVDELVMRKASPCHNVIMCPTRCSKNVFQ